MIKQVSKGDLRPGALVMEYQLFYGVWEPRDVGLVLRTQDDTAKMPPEEQFFSAFWCRQGKEISTRIRGYSNHLGPVCIYALLISAPEEAKGG